MAQAQRLAAGSISVSPLTTLPTAYYSGRLSLSRGGGGGINECLDIGRKIHGFTPARLE